MCGPLCFRDMRFSGGGCAAGTRRRRPCRTRICSVVGKLSRLRVGVGPRRDWSRRSLRWTMPPELRSITHNIAGARMNRFLNLAVTLLLPLLAMTAGKSHAAPPVAPPAAYFDNTGRSDTLSGGVRMIPVETPKGTFHVWTKRVGNNPRIKVLLLHGGPGMTHEYLEAFDSYFPGEGIEYYYYDQLGSAYSDQPKDTDLWTLPRFVEEVEQVRKALGLGPDNFYLYGHSW